MAFYETHDNLYDVKIINDNLEKALEEFKGVIKGYINAWLSIFNSYRLLIFCLSLLSQNSENLAIYKNSKKNLHDLKVK